MVGGVGRDGPGLLVLLKAAQTVHQAGGAGDCPVAAEGFRFAEIGGPGGAQLLGDEPRGDVGELVGLGDAPGRGAVADEGVAKQDDGSHVLDGDAACLVGHGEAVGGGDWGYHGQGRLAVAAIESLGEVGLLGLGGQSGRRPSALHVYHHQGQLGHHGQADGLALEGQAGA